MNLYRRLLPPGSLCFDVGANVGEKSEALLEAGARVVAFEPNPLVLPELRARCGYHANWAVLPTALGSECTIAALHVPESHVNSTLVDGREAAARSFSVPVLTLEMAIRRFGRPDFCKIDVEGWELEVFKGLAQSIPLICFEFQLNEWGIAKTISCLERLAEFGPGHANVTPAETSSFHFDEWIPLKQFLAWFPGDLKQTLPGDHYGDIFVANGEQRPAWT